MHCPDAFHLDKFRRITWQFFLFSTRFGIKQGLDLELADYKTVRIMKKIKISSVFFCFRSFFLFFLLTFLFQKFLTLLVVDLLQLRINKIISNQTWVGMCGLKKLVRSINS